MSKIWEILHKPDTLVFFDIDGTLTSFNYGEYQAHHELDGTEEFKNINIFENCKRLKPLYEYIVTHDINRLFCISRDPHGHAEWKSEWVNKQYGIPKDHCFYVAEAAEKPALVARIVNERFPGIDPHSVVLMDDNDDTLGMYMSQIPFCTAHPMIFMEYL